MDQSSAAVLKKTEVKLTQSVQLGCAPAGQGPHPPQARIVEQNDTDAVVEVVCGCGRKILLLCDCTAQGGGPSLPAGATDPNPAPGANNAPEDKEN